MARNVLTPHESSVAIRTANVFDDFPQTRGPIRLATPAGMRRDGQHLAARLVRFVDQVVDRRAAVFREISRVAISRRDKVTTVVQRLRIRDDQQFTSVMFDEIRNVVIAGIGVVKKATRFDNQLASIHAGKRTAIPAGWMYAEYFTI